MKFQKSIFFICFIFSLNFFGFIAHGWVAPHMRKNPKRTPTVNTISADLPLVASTSTGSGAYLANPGTTALTPGAAGTQVGNALTGTAIATTGSATATSAGTGLVPTAPTALTNDATAAFTATITAATTFPSVATPACSLLSPFAAVPCTLPSFSFASSSMTSGSLQVKAYASNGYTTEFLNSNALTVFSLVVNQISNTTNSNSTTDAPTLQSVYGGKLYFSASKATGAAKEFTFDGTTLARMGYFLGDTTGESLGSLASGQGLSCNGYFYWGLRTPDTGGSALAKVGAFDGTTYTQISNTAGTGVDDLGGGTLPSVCYNNKLFYHGKNSSAVSKLFSISGVNAPIQVTNAVGSNAVADSSAGLFLVNNSVLYFPCTATVLKLCAWDDVGSTFKVISNTYGNASTADVSVAQSMKLIAYNGKVYFISRSAGNSNGYKFFKTDGSTFLSPVSNTSGALNATDNIISYLAYGSSLYFVANNTSAKSKLFEYSDTGPTLTLVSNTANAVGTSDAPANLTGYNSKLFFTAINSSGFTKLFAYNGSTIQQITNTAGSAANDAPSNLVIYNSRLYFSSNNASGVSKLYMYDDNLNWLVQASNTTGSSAIADAPGAGVVLGTRLYFVSNLTATVNKVFRICDTSAGCTN